MLSKFLQTALFYVPCLFGRHQLNFIFHFFFHFEIMISKNIFHLSIDFIIKNIYILSKKQNELKCKILYCDTSLNVSLLYFFHHRFLRGISYREFTRLVHGYLGGRRIPLPACTYHKIRATFPEEKASYAGFETEDIE